MINQALYDNGSGGRKEIKGNTPVINSSLHTELYIALFGGQVEKPTTGQTETKNIEKGWWGNKPYNPQRWVNSETEAQLKGMVINPNNISKLESALKNDLKKFEKYGTVSFTIGVKTNRVDINIKIAGDSKEYLFVWDNTVKDVIISTRTK